MFPMIPVSAEQVPANNVMSGEVPFDMDKRRAAPVDKGESGEVPVKTGMPTICPSIQRHNLRTPS
jgi:hypothetical protein